ncbi:MAG TPA: LytTR family DNA-binding domain-containing protein [Puia sp.]|nr:LytTR family DNA-binding domain-containing protein [Puia sp.]
MNFLKCMVVDDEPLAVDVVVDYLRQLEIHPVCCENGIEALRQLRDEHFDLLFLDIEMPGMNGIHLLKSLPHRPAVVLTTAYRDYAVEGFDLEVLDYLVKPFSFARMQQAMDKFERWRGKKEDGIFLKVDKQLINIPMKDILYVESKKDYVKVYTTCHEYLCHLTLTDITARLAPERFFRIHRSYTVALDKIGAVKDNCVRVRDKALPVSRELRMELKRRLQR